MNTQSIDLEMVPTDGSAKRSGISSSEVEALQLRFSLAPLAKWACIAGVLLGLIASKSVENWLCGAMVLVATYVPVRLWCSGRVRGLPIWPVIALVHFLFYGMPFFAGHPFTLMFTFEEQLAAAATVSVVVLVITICWAFVAQPDAPQLKVIKLIEVGEGTRVFALFMLLACLFQLNSFFWYVVISSELFGVLRAILFSVCLVSLFCMAYDAGRGALSSSSRNIFMLFLIVYVMSNAMSLYLYSAMSIAGFAWLGYCLGSGRLPWKSLVAMMLCFSVLQAGKVTLRSDYWGDESQGLESITEVPRFFGVWVETGVRNMVSPPSAGGPDSLVERGSLTQMLLKPLTESPDLVPFLDGATYMYIPQVLVPRFIWPDRPSALEMTRQLSLHYGLMTEAQSESTSVGWGLIPEAFANFGYAGCLGFAIVYGFFMGWVQRLCGRAPLKSGRGLFALLILVSCANIVADAASLVSTLVQSSVGLLLLVRLVMRDGYVKI